MTQKRNLLNLTRRRMIQRIDLGSFADDVRRMHEDVYSRFWKASRPPMASSFTDIERLAWILLGAKISPSGDIPLLWY